MSAKLALAELKEISAYLEVAGFMKIPESINMQIKVLEKELEKKYTPEEDAISWGTALNEASWKFLEVCPEKSALLFNTCKVSLRAAIVCYLEAINKRN